MAQEAQAIGATGPDNESSDYKHCYPFWRMISDILEGVDAMRNLSYGGQIGSQPIQLSNVTTQLFAQSRGLEPQSPYLPKFPNEPYNEYDRRRRNAFLTNIYSDISSNLSSKPFSKTCELADDSGDDLKKISENIDGLGNNLHVFAGQVFKTALDKGITWIMSDYTKVPAEATLETERNLGARPYWVHIKTEDLIAVYSKFINGVEIIFEARIKECSVELDGYKEKEVTRIREMTRDPIVDENDNITGFEPAVWTLYQENRTKDEAGREAVSWDIIDSGPITIGIIPLVPIIFGKRDGTSWRVSAPLKNIGFMQVKLFQMESNLDYTKELTAFPMLTGNGIAGTDDKGATINVPVGPRAVLFAPPGGDGGHGEWHFIEPGGSSLSFLQTDVDKHKTEMRDLGMQPLTASNLTVVTTTNVAAKAHNAVQAWALKLKDALEQAWYISAVKWLKQAKGPEVNVHTDFGVSLTAEQDFSTLLQAESAGLISPQTTREEFKRRGLLSDSFSEEEEQKRLAEHQSNQVLQPEKQIDPVTGMPIVVQPKPGIPNPPQKPPLIIKPGDRVVN